MTGSTCLCKANSPCGADISANNNVYQDYLLQGMKINLFFQLLSNELYQLPFEWWHMAVIYSTGDKSCWYKVLRAPSWTALIADVNNDRGLLSHVSINPRPHCSIVLESSGHFQQLWCKSVTKGAFLQHSWFWILLIIVVESWGDVKSVRPLCTVKLKK